MALPETDPVRARIRAVITVEEFCPPPLRPLFDPDGRREWISTASFGDVRAPDVKDLAQCVTIAPVFLEHARSAVLPGATLIITDVRVGSQTLSGPGVNVLTAG